MFDTIKKRWFDYWDWTLELPVFPSVTIFLATIIIPVLILSLGISTVLDSHFKSKCLDSQLARRWSPTNKICQEYHNGEWIKVDFSEDGIYYYNDVASRGY